MDGKSSEPFDQKRMARCVGVFQKLADHWTETGQFAFRVIADQSLEDKPYEELAKMRFLVGVGEDLTELSLPDLLTAFKMYQDHCAKQSVRGRRSQHEFTVRYAVKTSFTQPEAMTLLRDITAKVGIEARPPGSTSPQPAGGE